MPTLDIEGRWIGFYTYGKEYSLEEQLTSVPFTVEFKNTLVGFVGKMTEEVGYGGLDDEIYVEGQMDMNSISFTKFYTKKHYVNENGETVSEESDDPNIVYYDGAYDSQLKKFIGEWTICLVSQDENGNDIEYEEDTGGWEMWKQE
jgi:hypothetical protein